MVKKVFNYVTLLDSDKHLEWLYKIEDEEEWEFIKKKAEIDEEGNYILPMPIIAALQGWSPVKASSRISKYMKNLGVPELALGIALEESFKLPELDKASDEELEKYLSIFGSIRAYLEAQVAYHDSERSMLNSTFEESMNRTMYELASGYEKKPTKEILRGEAIQTSPQLKKLRQELIEKDALHKRVAGFRDAYKAAYEATSRIVTLRVRKGEG